MSISRTTQISLAVILVGAVLPGSLALSAQGAPRSITVSPAATSTTAASTAVTSQITRRSKLARHSRCNAPPMSPLSYHWPVKPFNRQHPIRGYFSDPRTLTSKNAVYAPGARGPFNFHNGVDIVTTTGTPVYPVVSGVASTGNNVVFVRTADRRVFQYYHVRPSIQSGQWVVAYKTVLGHTLAHFGHVHLIEGAGTEKHNPLDPGHLEPYGDKTAPVVSKVQFSDSQGNRVYPSRLSGKIDIAADAHDMPALPIVGTWPGLGVTAPLIEWELRTSSGSAVIPRHAVADFRQTEPPNEDFWNIYSVGTRQNKYGSIKVEQIRLVGRYSYNLTPTGLDTRTLPNGVYVLTIKAADTCGNSGSLSERITIEN
ncbi:MAG: M23 family metallopeptidase [Gaiellaceae bacterium]